MENKNIIIVPLLSLLLCCNGGTIKKGETIHPILNIEVINISSEGLVDKLQGEIFLKKNGSNKYIKVHINDYVNLGDILELRKGASIKINFKDKISKTINPVEKDSWFTFEKPMGE